MTKKEKKDVYTMVNDKVLQMMEEGKFSWVKTWKGSPDGTWNYNYATKRQYSFLNTFMLDFDREKHGYKSTAWVTAKQMINKKIRWAGKSTSFIVFFIFLEGKEEKDEEGNVIKKGKKFPYLKRIPVWNLDQTDVEVEEKAEIVPYQETEADKYMEAYFIREKIEVKIGGDKACYSPSLDIIKMPNRQDFQGEAEYYSTLFHEAIHSTGRESRLNRIEATYFGSEEYSKEELVAEIGASYLMAMFGMFEQTQQNNVAYLQAWMEKIRENKYWLVSAFGKAEKAIDFIEGERE